jgi:ribosomal protein S17
VSIRECKPFSKSKKFEVIGGAKWFKCKLNCL